MDNKRELMQKLKALAEQGVGGEKANAQKILAEWMIKYNISEDELNEDRIIECEFKAKNRIEEILFQQIIYKVINKTEIYGFARRYTGRKIRNLLGCKCTQSQRIEIEFLFDFYNRLYQKESETFLHAFIQKHELFGTLTEGESPTEVDLDECRKMFLFQNGMSDETPIRQITSDA